MTKFLGKNDLTTSELFFQRLNYTVNAFPPEEGSLYLKPVNDFQFAERLLYGRINRNHNTIKIVGPKLTNIKSLAKKKAELQAPNFVVDAFEAMVQEYQKLGLAGKLDSADPHLSELKAHAAFVSPDAMYVNYRQLLKGFFLKEYITPEIDATITNFSSFLKHFLSFVVDRSALYPITKTAFIPSTFCSPLVSGLSIDVSALDPSDDSNKEEFMKSRNFEYLVKVAKKYGFFIDKFIPWRLTADIGSIALLQYSSKYRAESDTAILATYYQRVGGDDLADLQKMALDFYNSLVQRRPVVKHYDKEKLQLICRQPMAPESLINNYPVDYWIDKYIDIRYNEQKKPVSEGELTSFKKSVKSLLAVTAVSWILSIINDEVNGFDNFNGSFAKKKLARERTPGSQALDPTY